MSTANPYAPTQEVSTEDLNVRQVKVKPIDLLKRSYRMMGEQYWLFFGITLVGILIASAVPFGLIMGPMIVGIYLCFIERGRRGQTEFATLFRGFDFFLESFIAFLCMLGLSLLVMVPFMIALFAMLFAPIISAAAANPNAPPPPPEFTPGIILTYIAMLFTNFLIYMPFIFTFQLIADRHLKAIPAIKMSLRGVGKNFWGIVWFMLVVWFVSMVGALMCYVPAFLIMPISFGAMFLLYREIYGMPQGLIQPSPPATGA